MEDSRVSTLLAALKLDEHPLANQLVYVEERNNADGSFVLSAIIKYQVEKNKRIIFVPCHNSFGHFQSIGLKLGYNLASLKESGQVYVLDMLEKIRNEDFLSSAEPLKRLYAEIKQQVNAWKGESVCIVIENIGNFLLVGAEDFFTFVNYLRVITVQENDSSVVLSLHNFPESPDFDQNAKSIRHLADVTVILNDLQTGRANDVTGHLTITRKENNFKKNTFDYQYQLQDRSVTVFSPGSRNFV